MLPSRLSGLNSTGVGGFGGGTGGEWGERTPVAQPNVMAPRQAQPTVAQPSGPAVSGEAAGQLAQIMGGLNKPAASETPLSVLSVGQDPYEAQYNQYANIYKEQADQEIDPNRLYQDKLKQYQSQIDAVNEIYRQRLNSERLEAQGRMGSTAAMAGRSGVLGSDFGASQLDKTTGYNADIRAATQAEQAALIGQIMGQVRKDAADELAAKTQAKMNGAEAYMEFLQGASERRSGKAQNIARMLLEKGLEPDQVDWDQTLKGSNLKSDEVISAYQSAKTEQEAAQSEADLKNRKTEAEINKINADIAKGKVISLGEGSMLYNTETGEYFKNPKTYAPSSSTSSSVGITSEDKRSLLGSGWTEDDMQAIQDDVKANGLPAVIEQARKNSATQAQIAALQKVYGANADSQQFLSKDYFSKLFTEDQLKKAALDAGFGTPADDGEGWFNLAEDATYDTEGYLNHLDGVISAYRTAGYTDQDILKMMQKK